MLESSLLTTLFFTLQISYKASGGGQGKKEPTFLEIQGSLSLIHQDRCRPPYQYLEISKVKKQKRKVVEFLEYAIYLFIDTILNPKGCKGNHKDAYKRARYNELKIRKKNDPRIRHRKYRVRIWQSQHNTNILYISTLYLLP